MDQYVGEIRLFAFLRSPTGWLPCDGKVYNIADYPALNGLIGTTYGGDGKLTFAVPNLSGTLPIGQGQGTDLSARTMGTRSGDEQVAVAMEAVPAHSHTFLATTVNNSTSQLSPAVLMGADSSGEQKHYVHPAPVAIQKWIDLSPSLIAPVGGSTAHDNIMPGLGLNYCIAWQGIFPTREN